MDRQQQDLAWASLPKETRDKIRSTYFCIRNSDAYYNNGFVGGLLQIYGEHNLTSDTEPKEMLMVERKRVQELYTAFEIRQAESSPNEDSEFWRGNKSGLKYLFGDKCLPDKEEPKPKFKVGDKVYQTSGTNRLEEYTIKKVYTDKKRGIVYGIQGLITILGVKENNLCWSYQNPYTEPETNDTEEKSYPPYLDRPKHIVQIMEEKELNLCELLKGCVGEWFYVTPCGEMELKEINKLELKPLHFSRDAINCLAKTDGRAYENGSCIIYPSRALYEKYPLDAKAAWDEWASERKPKYSISVTITTGFGDIATSLGENIFYEFRTEEIAQQAAKGIREYLKTFHENNIRK